MREFKFRVWDKKQKTMFYTEPDSADPKHDWTRNGEYTNLSFHIDFKLKDKWWKAIDKNLTIMQYTGKKGFSDRNIYEGDILFYEEAGDDGDERHWLVVLWIEEWSMFASVFIDEYKKYLEKGAEALDEVMFWTYTLERCDHYHYAGNIFEDPQLLDEHESD